MYRRPSTLSSTAMIQEKSLPKAKQSSTDKIIPTVQKTASLLANNLTASNQVQQHFNFKLQDSVVLDNQTIGWTYNVPILSPNEKYLYIATQNFSTVILDYVGDNFPQTISVGLQNFNGFINKQGQSTNKIIVLNLYQVSTAINPQGIQYRDLVYKSESNIMWELGTLRNLNFMLYLDDQVNPVNFPITNPINLTFKIIHLSI